MIKKITCTISGRVQGVMFRDFAKRKARGLQLSGYVENLPDHLVRVVAEGIEENLQKYIEHLHKGPFLAKVLRVEVEWGEPERSFSDFNIRY